MWKKKSTHPFEQKWHHNKHVHNKVHFLLRLARMHHKAHGRVPRQRAHLHVGDVRQLSSGCQQSHIPCAFFLQLSAISVTSSQLHEYNYVFLHRIKRRKYFVRKQFNAVRAWNWRLLQNMRVCTVKDCQFVTHSLKSSQRAAAVTCADVLVRNKVLACLRRTLAWKKYINAANIRTNSTFVSVLTFRTLALITHQDGLSTHAHYIRSHIIEALTTHNGAQCCELRPR